MINVAMLVVVTILYSCTGIGCIYRGDWPHGGMWLSYAAANFFLMIYELKQIW